MDAVTRPSDGDTSEGKWVHEEGVVQQRQEEEDERAGRRDHGEEDCGDERLETGW